jgi:hypothetical protein
MASKNGSTISRSQLQKQLSDIFAAARSNGYKLDEIMPKEVKGQFSSSTELKAARACIQEVEAREKKLQAANDKLLAELKRNRRN